jgi:hypothetical protein
MDFYSARLLFIILVADGPGRKRNHYDESVIVFRAKDLGHLLREAKPLREGLRPVSELLSRLTQICLAVL